MTDLRAQTGAADTGDSDRSRVESILSEAVDDWKSRIDELRVQADLAKLDVRDQATKQLDIAQNSCLAAATKLREAGHDAAVSVRALADGVRNLLNDVKSAFDAAKAVIDRG